ncbi:polymorphic toxin-type HINT domain-containing protein [Dactylosporangium sp. NBC_01737]|uniref:LamG-like jellyroll fold domain-containing protein n=1 Tax=Dactylosporangium sp. NBC_01737 TaxID=2975959 RepID=UPI002E103A54|nr:polymorphic toxin-type HINT domain-containing protein [Dactylosporangium sp. NBC_01737]
MSVVTVVAVALSLGLPSALVPAGRGLVGWSALRDWLVAAPSWAREDPKVPQQQRGKGVDGHYVTAPMARNGESKRKAPGELKRDIPSTGAVAGKSTGPAKKGFDAGTSRRLASMADAKVDVFENTDGSFTRRVYKDPVNFKAADGSWRPIDTGLRAATGNRLETTSTSFKLSFAAGAARKLDTDGSELPGRADGAAAAAEEDLARITVEPGVELAYSLAGARLNKPTVEHAVARYGNVLPGVDLELGAKPTGSKESLILRSKDVPTEYLYPLKLQGLTARLNTAGDVEFVTANGKVALTTPRGYLEDSSNSHAGGGETSDGVTYDLVQTAGGPALKVSIDGVWLRDPARKFPVTLDPDYNLVDTYFDTYGISTSPDSIRNLEQTLAVGSWNGTDKARTFINFDNFPATLAGRKLDSARLYLFMTYQGDADGNPCVARPYNVYPITGAWNASTLTWNNAPAYDTNKLMGTDSPNSSQACTNSGQVRNQGVWSAPWLNSQYMIDWAALGGVHGLAVTASETDTAAWKRFTSSDTSLTCPSYFGNTLCTPFIEVNYTANTPPQLDARYPANNTSVSTLTPEFSAKGSDPDNYPNRGLRYNFMLQDDQGAQVAQSGWTDGFWKPPAGTLKWGKTYTYYVLVDDRSSIGPANPVPFAFSTAVPQQLVSSSLAQNGGKGFEGSVGNYTTRDVDAQVTTVGPALSIAREYNSLDTRAGSAFGQGWSSLVDMQVREGNDADGALQTAAIRYPNGQVVTFGRNNDGTWTPPPGRFSIFKAITGGYSLTDKDSSTYEFIQAQGLGVYGLTKITDANGRALTMRYDVNGRVGVIQSLGTDPGANLVANPSVEAAANATTPTAWQTGAWGTNATTFSYPSTGHGGTRSVKVQTTSYTDGDAKWYFTPVPVTPNATYTFSDSYQATVSTRLVADFTTTGGGHSYVELATVPATTGTVWGQTAQTLTAPANAQSVTVLHLLDQVGSLTIDDVSLTPGTPATINRVANPSVEAAANAATPEAWQTGGWGTNATTFSYPNTGHGGTRSVKVQTTSYTDGDAKWYFTPVPVTPNATYTFSDSYQATVNTRLVAEFATTSGGHSYVELAPVPATTGAAWGQTTQTLTAPADAQSVTVFHLLDQVGSLSIDDVSLTAGSPRQLTLTWATPAGATAAHVATVTTDPTDPAVPSSTLTWNYTYTGDQLTKVCPPGTTTDCAGYEYQAVNQHNGAVLNTGPYSFWRFNDPISGGTQARSGVLSNDGIDNGIYSNVALEQPAALPLSTSKSAGFNGTTSSVKLPEKLATDSSYQSISMWFKTTAINGVLFSYQKDLVTPGATTPGYYNPALYVDNVGKLRGSLWNGTVNTIVTANPVNDGQWHHAALAGNGGSQSLYLDGAPVGSMAGVIQLHNLGQDKVYIGAGFLSNAWPANTLTTPTATFFNGSIADVAYYNKPLTQDLVTALHTSGTNPSSAMSKVTSNAGRVRAVIGYDTVSGRVNQVTDEAGGLWQVGQPTLSGSSQVYASTVLGSQPREYFRLNDTSLPAQPKNQVADALHAWYNNVGFDTTQPNTTSPFSDSYGAVFDGTSSYIRYDNAYIVAPQYQSSAIEMWFKTPAGYSTSSVLYAYQTMAVDGSSPATPSWTPALYIGNDGKLRGGLWTGSVSPMTSATNVNDGNWHHVVLSTHLDPLGADKQTLYLDNAPVGTKDGEVEWVDSSLAYIGAGTTRFWPGASGDVSYFKGNISEFAYYDHELSTAQIDAHFKASKSALAPPPGATGPVITPVTTVTVTDPGGKPARKMYDVVNGSRLIASTDTLGNTTSYGYDTGGFVNVVYDPLGQKTETAKDVRGNTVRTTTCTNETMWSPCQDTLYTYYPDSTSATLAPDPRNDQVLSIIGNPGSGRTTDTAVTTLAYDTSGNRLSVTSPSVPGFPNGRTTSTTYTTATTAAVGGGVTPAGLPMTVTSVGGRLQRTEYNAAGDAVRVTDPAGLVTEFSYDGLGRVTQQKVLAPGYPAGLITTYTYDADGQLVQTTEPKVTNAVTGAQHTTRTTDMFDPDGNVTSRTVSDLTGGDASRAVTSDYNPYGQLVKSVDPTGAVTLYGYDGYGRQNSMVECDSNPAPGTACPTGDRLQVVTQVFDSEGQLLTSTTSGKDGTSVQETSNAYYANGALASSTDAENRTTKYDYFDNGTIKRISRTDGTKTYVVKENWYDGAGNPQSVTENNGATKTDFTVDNTGRLIAQRVRNGFEERTTNYVYDADDRVVLTRNTVNTDEWFGTHRVVRDVRNTYDAMNRMTSERLAEDPNGGPVGWWSLDGEVPSNQWQSATDGSGSNRHMDSFRGGTHPSLSGGFATLTDDDMQTTEQVLDTTQSYSVSAWVKLNNLNTTHTAVSQTGMNRGAFYLQYNKDWNTWALQTPSADVTGPVSYPNASSSTAPVTNTWVHLVGVFDAATKRLSIYVNNARGTDGVNPTPIDSMNGLEIGGSHWGDFVDHFQGSIDNVQVYQRALTDADVGTLWAGGNGRTGQVTASSPELVTTYTVDQRGLTTDMVDPNGNTTSYIHDEDGNLIKTLAPTVTTEAYGTTPLSVRPTITTGYNAFGEPVEQQDPLGNVTQVRMDAAGRPWKTVAASYTPPGGAPIVDASTTTVYDKLGRVSSTTDPRNKTTWFEYDTLGDVTKVTGPTGKITTAKYDGVGELIETVDPTGAKGTATYDFLGRKLTSTQIVRQPTQVANTTLYDYGTGTYGSGPEAGPWLRKVTTPEGVSTEATYNNLGEPITGKDGAGNVTSTAYDGLGRPVLVTNPDNTKTATVYDGAGRPVKAQQLDAAGAVQTTRSATYDNNGNPITSTDPRGHTTTLTYDPLGQVVNESQPVTASTAISTSFGYDAAGHPTRFTDGRSNEFWTTYNTWGLPESQIEPATTAYPGLADRTFTSVYDLGGRLASKTLPGGVQLNYTYDDLNQVTGQTGTGADAATVARTFGYDDAGRITSLSAPGGTNAITYDDRGLPLSITGLADATSYTYNGDGKPTSRTDAAGATNFTYDTAGRLATVANPTTSVNLSVAYNTLSQPSTITYGANSKKRTFTYDALHRLKTDTVTSFDGTVIQGAIAYDYDPNSNLTSKVTTGFTGASSNSYGYDFANRLTSWTSGSTTTNYAYDASGNRLQNGAKTFAYDQRNQLLSQSGGTSYAYTARGTLRLTSGPGGVHNTTADAYGQVITQQAAGGNRTYSYDAVGRAVKAGFKYSGLSNTLADDGTTKYTRGPGGELLGAADGGGAIARYVWTDLHTDVVGQFSATSFSLTGSAAYDPLGTVLAKTGLVGSLGYQSEYTEQVTGRVNMHARWYNTDTGQFDTRDTAGNSPVPSSINANRYQYGDGNPLTTTDPTGHWGWSSVKNAFKAVAAPVVNTVAAVYNAASTVYNYVASGQAWQDVKNAANYVADKAKAATKVVVNSTKKWVKQKVQTVKDTVNDVKKCMSGGVTKCVKDTVKAGIKYVDETVKNTVTAFKEDPWKFIATAAVGIVAAVAVGALCATGVGCLILAGAVAGALSSGAGYMIDVGRGDAEFSWSGLADTMIQGGLDGALSAGVDKFTGGASKYAGKGARAAMPRGFGGGSRPGLPSASRPGGGGHPAAGRPSSSGSGGGAPRAGSSGGGGGSRRAGGGGGGTGAANDRRDGGAGGGGSGCSCACPGKKHSFDPSTLVLLANGSLKAIKDVELGDVVVATDPTTGESDTKIVEALHRNDDTDLTELVVTVDHGAGGEAAVVETTWHHPFWNDDTDTWADAQDLRAGDHLRTIDGDQITVAAVRNYVGAAEMRDLTVEDLHTYYVVVGGEPVLVHNVDLNALNACPGTSTTHYAQVDVFDSQGVRVDSYPIRSGQQTPAESARGPRGGETLSHTENRVARMSGGVPSYGANVVWDDEFFLERPVPDGGYVVIEGTRSPCSSCRGAMSRAAEDTGAVFAYVWEENGMMNWWQTQ